MTLIKSISGIRGTIGGPVGEGLTPVDVVKFTYSYCVCMKKRIPMPSSHRYKVVVGRDARISGEMVEQLVCGTLVSCGVDVVKCGFASTPTTELAVRFAGADGGIIITASHNPRQWNALKLLNNEGEFFDKETGEKVLAIAEKGDFEFAPVDTTTPFAVSIQDFELVGCGGVNAVYTGELSEYAGQPVINTSNYDYIRTYRRGIVVSGNNYADGRAYAKSVNITNVKASGFDVALRINHAVNAYLSDVTISNCFSNGIESNQNIITMNNMTIGQVGAFAIELTPDDMKDKDTANPTGTAGANYDQTAKCTMTGYIHCSNFNNGASTLYMQGLAAELGMSIPSMIEGITAGTIGAIKSAIPTADTSKMMEVAYECLQNTSGEINFYLLIFINTRDDFAAFKEEGNTLNRFAEYASDSSMGNMISMTEVLMHVAQDPTWTGYRDYNYIKFDLITGTTLGNIGQVIMINQAYNG